MLLKTYSVRKPAGFCGCEARISRRVGPIALGLHSGEQVLRKHSGRTPSVGNTGVSTAEREVDVFHAAGPPFAKTQAPEGKFC